MHTRERSSPGTGARVDKRSRNLKQVPWLIALPLLMKESAHAWPVHDSIVGADAPRFREFRAGAGGELGKGGRVAGPVPPGCTRLRADWSLPRHLEKRRRQSFRE